jgi:hypothetical protein
MSHDTTPCTCPTCGNKHGITTLTCDTCEKEIQGKYYYLYEKFFEYEGQHYACSLPCLKANILRHVRDDPSFYYNLSISDPKQLLELAAVLPGEK